MIYWIVSLPMTLSDLSRSFQLMKNSRGAISMYDLQNWFRKEATHTWTVVSAFLYWAKGWVSHSPSSRSWTSVNTLATCTMSDGAYRKWEKTNVNLNQYVRVWAPEQESLQTLSEDREWRCTSNAQWQFVPNVGTGDWKWPFTECSSATEQPNNSNVQRL